MAVLLVGLVACGDSTRKSTEGEVVAEVGHSRITKGELTHWMLALAGADFYEHTGKRMPSTLVAGPFDIGSCSKTVVSLASESSSSTAPSEEKSRSTCKQLFTVIQQQALSYLIVNHWRAGEALKSGIVASNREIDQRLQAFRAERYPRAQDFTAYLQNKDWTLSDKKFEIARDIVNTRYLAVLQRKDPSAGLAGAFKRLASAESANRSKTTCRPGYEAPECREYVPKQKAQPSAAVMLERIAQGV